MPPGHPSTSDSSTLPAASPDARWFADEVHAHDRSLKAYLRGTFPSVGDVEDVVQESYLRVWKARARQPIASAKAFLFRVARNVALDGLRRDRASPIMEVDDLASIEVADTGSDVSEAIGLREKATLLADAISTLTPRTREVVTLCKLRGMSHQAAAHRLGISERTVDELVLRGIARLSTELRRRGHGGLFGP